MAADSNYVHDRYRRFIKNLSHASDPDDIVGIFYRMAQPLNASAAALISTGNLEHDDDCSSPARTPVILASRGPEALWSDYTDLCRAGRDLISRVLRLSPHTLALSDIHHHPRLSRRARNLETMLGRHELNDVFAVPAIGHQLSGTMAIIAGRDLDLRRSKRHLMGRISMDVLSRLATVGRTRPDDDHRLTSRQLEIAHWLIAGKTDWEIGEILRISRKTVNYHVEHMKRRYGVHSCNQLVAVIMREGGLPPPSPGPNATLPTTRPHGHDIASAPKVFGHTPAMGRTGLAMITSPRPGARDADEILP